MLFRRRRPVSALVSALALALGSIAGYVSIVVIERYLWLAFVVAAMVAAVGLHELDRSGRRRLAIAAAVLAVATSTVGSLEAMRARIGEHDDLDAIAAAHPELDGARVAGTADWDRTLALCVRADCHYLGKVGVTGAVGPDLLDQFEIDYVIDFDAANPVGAVTPDGLEPGR